MTKLNKLKFETYSTHDYFKENVAAIKHFRSIQKFEDALGYDDKSGGYIVLHQKHCASGIEDEMPVCLVLKNQGFCVELIAEYVHEKGADVLVNDTIFEIKRLKKGTDLSTGIQNHFRRAKKQSENHDRRRNPARRRFGED